tara:strand:+ start:4265 stop:4738 length:474 start_codon:yes stop_codon:yes gene_type:complete
VDNYQGIILSLGSNIGNRQGNITNALSELEKISEIKQISSTYESEALLVTDQRSFYNIAVEISYLRKASDLLEEVKLIEVQLGRKKTIRYGPRLIDIDIIFFNKEIISTNELTIPHYDWKNRLFVVAPLCEIVEEFNIAKFNLNNQKVEKIGNINYK